MKDKGFSLVELLVVIAIASTLLSLVAPLGLQTVERVRSQTELVGVQRWLNRQGYNAFIRDETVIIEVEDDARMIARANGEVVSVKQLESLTLAGFDAFFFSSAGVPSRQKLSFITDSGREVDTVIAGALSPRSGY